MLHIVIVIIKQKEESYAKSLVSLLHCLYFRGFIKIINQIYNCQDLNFLLDANVHFQNCLLN